MMRIIGVLSCKNIKPTISKKLTRYFQKNIFVPNSTGNQAVSLRSFALFRSAVPVGRTSLRSTDTAQLQ